MTSLSTSTAFSEQVQLELDHFEYWKTRDFKDILGKGIEAQIAFHDQGKEWWKDMEVVVDGIRFEEDRM